MLDDALAVMDAVGWRSAHVLGGSMGAGIAQALAAENPERVRSLISCMGLPVDSGPLRTLRYIRPGVFRTLTGIKPGPSDEEQVEALVAIYRAIASPGYPFPETWARRAARVSHERHPRDPSTTQRQLAAGRAHHYRPLETITAPTLVVSGRADPLIRWQGGRDTATRIPAARFVLYPGMGHAIPRELFGPVIEEVQAHHLVLSGMTGNGSHVVPLDERSCDGPGRGRARRVAVARGEEPCMSRRV